MVYRLQKIVLVFLFVVSGISVLYAQNFEPLQSLIKRRFPSMAGKVFFEKINQPRNDTAEYYSKSGRLTIEAGSESAASYALYDYIKKYCRSSISHIGDNIRIPASLPETNQIEHIAAAYPLRYALNYCTYNYTMSFWSWAQWEKELDRMSLNGVNLMLAPMGTEEVWQKTLAQMGFSDKEIRAFIPGPAFEAWWLMGNLEGWGGPVSDALISQRTSLQKKILARMKELGIRPVIQGFTGIVPSSLKKHFPDAEIIAQGDWCGFNRPSVLAAHDSLFGKMAALYYDNFKQLYGSDFTYLGGDLFHEGGSTAGIDLTEEGRLVQQNMQHHFPDAVWVLQGWQDNPKEKMLLGLDKKHTLIIDLLGDRTETWLQRNQYGNFPWIWSTVCNFGGRVTTGGTLLRVLTEPKKAERIFGNGCTLQGTGIIPEGIENNDIVYQWALDGAWTKNVPPVQQKLNEFIAARYGANDDNLNGAWQYLLQTIYNGREPGIQGGQGGYESILCARPDTAYITSTSSWGPEKLWFDPELLTQAALDFTKALPRFKNVATFRYDLTDTWRQVINLKAREVYGLLMQAFYKKDKEGFEQNKNLFVQLLLLQDKWLGTNAAFRTGSLLNEAASLMPDNADKKLCELNARTQITYWGPDDENTPLHEYAYKEWQGILKDLYLKQWEAFFTYAEDKIAGKPTGYPDFFAMEKHWSEQQNEYAAEPQGSVEQLLPQIIKAVSQPLGVDGKQTVDFFNDKD